MVWKLLWQIPVLTHAAHTHTHTHTHIHTHTHALTHTLQSGVPVYIVDVHRSIYNSKPLNLRDAKARKFSYFSEPLGPTLGPRLPLPRSRSQMEAECQKIWKRGMQQTDKLCVCTYVTICCSISHCVWHSLHASLYISLYICYFGSLLACVTVGVTSCVNVCHSLLMSLFVTLCMCHCHMCVSEKCLLFLNSFTVVSSYTDFIWLSYSFT